MRVLLISWEYPPVIEGGLGRHVRKLSEHIVADGVDVHVLTRGGGRLPAEADQHGVIVHRVPVGGREAGERIPRATRAPSCAGSTR